MNLLNLGGLNSYITYITRNPQCCQKLSYKRRQFLKDLGLDLVKPMMERRAISFVGLIKPIKQAMSVCGITPAASVDCTQDKQGPTKSKRKRCYRCTMDRKSARICTKCKKPVPTILPRPKKSNADLHVSYKSFVFFQETCSICKKCKKLFVPCLNKNEQFHVDFHVSYVKSVVSQ